MINTTSIKEVKYLNKDFNQFRESLINFAKIYFKDTFNDFDPSDPGMMFIEMASYVGDVLSFYLDKQLKESMLISAQETKNVFAIAQSLGYKPRPTTPSKGKLEVFQLVPSIGTGENIQPDYRYAMNIQAGMRLASNTSNDNRFKTLSDVNFAYSSSFNSTNVTIYQVDGYGAPTLYLLKKSVEIESSISKTYEFQITDIERYLKLTIPDTNIISIDSITDSDGNSWYEVPYLAQDTIFESLENIPENETSLSAFQGDVPYLLKFKRVPRRFITRYNSDFTLSLQFGAGISDRENEEIIPNPDNVGLALPGRITKINESWDVANFLFSDAYGLIPNNTTLTVKYSVGGGIKSNVLPNTITNIVENSITFNESETNLDSVLLSEIKNSLSVNNPSATLGGRDQEDIESIRQNALAYFSAQGRTVTLEDYVMRCYSMPAKFGSVAKVYIIQDEQVSFENLLTGIQVTDKIRNPLALNLYTLSYNANKNLVPSNNAIKQNLKTYLDKYRMLTDAINIKDAYVINIKLNYEITVLPGYSIKEVLVSCTNILKSYFNIERWQINQPIIISELINLIASQSGVQSVMGVWVTNVFDASLGYNANVYDINSATRNGIIYPSKDPSIFEIKYPSTDILGRCTTY